MIVYFIIFVAFFIAAIRNWKATVLCWLPMRHLVNECVCLKYSSPAVSLALAIDSLLLGVYWFNRNKMDLTKGKYPFKEVFVAYLISYTFSMVFSIMPLSETFTNTIKFFIQGFVIVFLFYKALKTKEDVKVFLKALSVVVILITACGLYESIMKDNPVLDYIYINAPKTAVEGKMWYVPPFLSYMGELSSRFGLNRTFSFFPIHIAYGTACAMYLFLLIYILKKNLIPNKFAFSLICCLIAGVLMSNSKTPMAGLPFFLLAFYGVKETFNWKLVVSAGAVLVIIFMYFPNYLNNFFALFDSKLAEEGGGSNNLMRARQFQVGLELFARNPLFGNGVRSLELFSKSVATSDILGSESSWLKILPERGLLGLFAYLYLYFKSYTILKPLIKKRAALLFLMGLMVMETATGFMDFTIFGSIIIFISRVTSIYKTPTFYESSHDNRVYPIA